MLILAVCTALIALLAAIAFWKKPAIGPSGESTVKVDQNTDCLTVEHPFACFLDKAMQEKNPDLCGRAGMEKRSNCLKAYSEILNTKIQCSALQDLQFRMECEAAFEREPDAAGQATSSAALPPGLRVDQP